MVSTDPLYKFLKQQKGFAGWDEEHKLTPISTNAIWSRSNYKEDQTLNGILPFLVNRRNNEGFRFEPTEKIENINKKIRSTRRE